MQELYYINKEKESRRCMTDPELYAKLLLTLFSKSVWDKVGVGNDISPSSLRAAINDSLKEILELIKEKENE
jgi:hypothetical protein